MKRIAFVLGILAACGDDGGVRDLPDAPAGPVTVTLLAGRNPIANHTVIFQGPDGALIASVATDGEGKASAIVPEGGSVTALDLRAIARPEIRAIQTIMGVKPGDQLTMVGDAGIEQGQLSVTFPAYAGAHGYGVITSCGNETTMQTSLQLAVGLCSARVDALVYAYDDGFTRNGYIAKLDQPITAALDLGGETWTPLATLTTRYTNPPLPDASLDSSRAIVTPRGTFGCGGSTIDSKSLLSTVECPMIAGTTLLDVLTMYDNTQYYEIRRRAQASSTFDLADTLLHAPTSGAAVDAATRTVTWSETTTGAKPDFVMLNLSSGEAGRSYYWDILAPYGASLVLPALAGDAAAYALQPGDDVGGQLEVGTATGGYDAMRPFGPAYRATLGDEIERVIIATMYAG